ncbi:MAG: hypothetical protein DMG58_22710 [Acidobacteria bacterium]|nr:MAG: hypothetical protein DMG58_22710 [Acidobacteriota bacterium]
MELAWAGPAVLPVRPGVEVTVVRFAQARAWPPPLVPRPVRRPPVVEPPASVARAAALLAVLPVRWRLVLAVVRFARARAWPPPLVPRPVRRPPVVEPPASVARAAALLAMPAVLPVRWRLVLAVVRFARARAWPPPLVPRPVRRPLVVESPASVARAAALPAGRGLRRRRWCSILSARRLWIGRRGLLRCWRRRCGLSGGGLRSRWSRLTGSGLLLGWRRGRRSLLGPHERRHYYEQECTRNGATLDHSLSPSRR